MLCLGIRNMLERGKRVKARRLTVIFCAAIWFDQERALVVCVGGLASNHEDLSTKRDIHRGG